MLEALPNLQGDLSANILVQGDPLDQAVVLGVGRILLHFALVIENGLFLRVGTKKSIFVTNLMGLWGMGRLKSRQVYRQGSWYLEDLFQADPTSQLPMLRFSLITACMEPLPWDVWTLTPGRWEVQNPQCIGFSLAFCRCDLFVNLSVGWWKDHVEYIGHPVKKKGQEMPRTLW